VNRRSLSAFPVSSSALQRLKDKGRCMPKPLTDQIEHVVVLMFENRSFDNLLGSLYPDRTAAGLYRGLRGDESNPLDPANPSRGTVTVFQGPASTSTWSMPYPDPGELYQDMVCQLFGGPNVPPNPQNAPMSGFAWNYGQQKPAPDRNGGAPIAPVPANIMQSYSCAALPVSSYLAREFAVCDSWFASGPVQTLPNRVFAHCGTPSAAPGDVPGTFKARLNNPDYLPNSILHLDPLVTDTTIFELFDQAYPSGNGRIGNPLNWKIYYHDAPLSCLCKYAFDNWYPDSYDSGNVYHYDELIAGMTNFEYDIKHGRLPKYSFIEPRYTDFFGNTPNSNHPGGGGIDFSDPNGDSLPPPITVQEGEIFLNSVYEILYRYPETFAKTLLLVIYDEHGGLYDHVPPPKAVSPFTVPVTNFRYDRYGVRIPAIFISPLIAKSTIYPPREPYAPISDPPFDHTSLLRTLMEQFELKGSLTPRVSSAPVLTGLIEEGAIPRACPPPLKLEARAKEPTPRRPPITTVPRNAPNLAGALGMLYRHIEATGKPRS
jgi:phospholipase C